MGTDSNINNGAQAAEEKELREEEAQKRLNNQQIMRQRLASLKQESVGASFPTAVRRGSLLNTIGNNISDKLGG